jgi:hypothetical protein
MLQLLRKTAQEISRMIGMLLDEEQQNKKLEDRITSKVDEHFKDGEAPIISHVRS